MSYACYQPSGAVPVRAYLVAGVCFAIAFPLSILYAWLNLYLPVILDFFMCFALAFGLAFGVKHVCAKGKVRNPRWAGRFGFLLSLCVFYLQWAAWTAFQLDSPGGFEAAGAAVLSLAAQPVTIAGHALSLISSMPGFDKMFWLLAWLVECWALLFFPYFMGKMRAEEVFDEAGGDWASHVELPRKFRHVAPSAILELIHSSSATLSEILAPETSPDSTKFARLRVYSRNAESALVSILDVEIKDGRERVIESSPGTYLRVTSAELDELLADVPEGAGTVEPDPPELVDAIERLQAGDFQAAYEGALPFVAADDDRLYCDANRICAIVCSDSRQWPQALGYWKALFARESSAHNALQVATSAVMASETGQGIEWAERARTMNRVAQEMPDVAIITGMLTALNAAGQHEAAMPFLEQLRDYYTQLHLTDPTFLFGHRVPLFHVFLEKSGEILNKVLNLDERHAWYAAMLPHLDEPGKAELNAWLDGVGAEAQAQ